MQSGVQPTPRRVIAATIACVAVVAACAAPGAPATSAPTTAPASVSPAGSTVEISLTSHPELGDILVGEGGRTLYLFTQDSAGTSVCANDCAAAWPPLVVPAGAQLVGGDGVTGALATITRADGTLQATYAGAPLYYFAADAAAGDVGGQAVNDVWFVVSSSGAPVQGSSGAGATPPGEDEYTRGGGGATAAPAAVEEQATIEEFSFSPGKLTVPIGTTVTWTNRGSRTHTVTADDDSFESGRMTTRDRFSKAFTEAGTFTYHCAIHSQMTGTVVVTP